MSLIVLSTAALYTLSTPWIGGLLLRTLEIRGPVQTDELHDADAIVVLGGGRRIGAAEYGGDTLNALSLERLRYAAFLARSSGLPLLVAGGKPGGGMLAEGPLMRRILQSEYNLSPRWVEDASRTTWENARLSAAQLRRDRIRRIVLISHSWHLRRAAPRFEAEGFDVIPAGIQVASPRPGSVLDMLPTPAGLRDSTFALHEWLGILWYKLRSIF
jgi:uncharacterized SAM-binding protein YcdF (DUF218 family)